MADEPQGILRYNGFAADGTWSYVMASRKNPSVFQANFILGANIQPFGTVELSFGGQTVSMPNCRVKRVTITGGAGRWKAVVIEDWRWQWRFGYVFGFYNSFQKGVYQVDSKKTLEELCNLCTPYMGGNIQVPQLPEIYPTCDWNGQPAATELERLLDMVGYELVPRWGARAEIVKIGQGRDLQQDSRVMDGTATLEPAFIPQKLYVISTSTHWQEDLTLEPIGFEKDSTEIKHINDLTYKPKGGWTGRKGTDPYHWACVEESTNKELATKYVLRYFRIRGPVELRNVDTGSPFTVKYGEEWRLLPLSTGQLELYTPDIGRDKILKHPQVIGFFQNEGTGWENNIPIEIYVDAYANGFTFPEGDLLEQNYPEFIWNGHIHVDVQRGIVILQEPAYFIFNEPLNARNPQGRYVPLLKLRIAFCCRDPDSRQRVRKAHLVQPRNGIPDAVSILNPLKLLYEVGRSVQTDQGDFERQAEFYSQEVTEKFQDGIGYSIPMKGLSLDLELDGKFRSLQFKGGGGGGATTQVEWGVESPQTRMTMAEKKKQAEIMQAIADSRRPRESDVAKEESAMNWVIG